MLTTPQIEALLTRVTYKPGWSFRYYVGVHEGPHCTITAQVLDGYDPTQTITLSIECFLSPNDIRDEESFLIWMLYRAKRIEAHEAREFLHFDGKPYSDPHAEGADRDE